jgi:hypothetical protein
VVVVARRSAEQQLQATQGDAVSGVQQAIASDAVQAFGQDVLQVAPQKLVGGQADNLRTRTRARFPRA